MTRAFAVAGAFAFTAFVVAKGIPTLRHDWSWPIDRIAVPSFFYESIGGWLPVGFGVANSHPTSYLLALPLGAVMWLFGPFAGLALLAFSTGYCVMSAAANAASRWNNSSPAAIGVGLFALFNPWVYNEVVAGHLTMVLAYAGVVGLCAEMLRGRGASSVRLALWIALIEVQLQFFILAMIALVLFSFVTKKWVPAAAGILVALPSVVGVIAERVTLLNIPYGIAWQSNQSVAPGALLGLGGYFPGYSDRLGILAALATWAVLGLALLGAIAARRSRSAIAMAGAAALIYVVVLGVHGPLAAPYEWTVRQIPESGVFRELYDLAGLFAALLVLLACAATASVRPLSYVALGAGIVLPVAWLVHPPSDLWVGSSSYPHPSVAASPFTRVALIPAFQPLQLRDGRGDGADPDAFAYPQHVAPINEYFPSYPADMALARYERSGDTTMLRALGVGEIVERPWLVSRSNGGIGLAASSLSRPPLLRPGFSTLYLTGAMPLISECSAPRVVAVVNRLDACAIFFGDAGGYPAVRPIRAPSDSIDPRTAWIDARLGFARAPAIAQGIGGALTQSTVPHSVDPGSWLLAYVRGRLRDSHGRTLAAGPGTFTWISIPPDVTSVSCAGLCELVARTRAFPELPLGSTQARVRALTFEEIAPWLYVVKHRADSARLLRLNERYDPAWIAIDGGHILPHVRIDLSANGWFFRTGSPDDVALLQLTSLLQIVAETFGVLCVLWLLKALLRAPAKHVR